MAVARLVNLLARTDLIKFYSFNIYEDGPDMYTYLYGPLYRKTFFFLICIQTRVTTGTQINFFWEGFAFVLAVTKDFLE